MDPSLIISHVLADTIAGVAYVVIAFTLMFIWRQRRDLPLGWMSISFAAFIAASAATQFIDVWTLWYPDYWLSACIKGFTAIASGVTAFAFIKLIPQICVYHRSTRKKTPNRPVVCATPGPNRSS